MSQPSKPFRSVLARGVLGFVAGFIVAIFMLIFLGASHGHWDLSARELEQEYRAQRIALLFAAGTALLAMATGRIRVPRFLAVFVVIFGLIAVIPFWHCEKTSGFLPFGTPYINGGYSHADAIQLACHTGVAIVLAGAYESVRRVIRARGITTTADEDSHDSDAS